MIPAFFAEPGFTDPTINLSETIKLYRTALQQADQHLRDRFQAGDPVQELVHARAEMIDQLLINAWRRFETPGDPQAHGEMALIAVGGYGRAELHPGSDIDLMILLPEDDHRPYESHLQHFLVFLWDIGLEVGHSVRSIPECEQQAAADVTVITNLIESRLLVGPESLFAAMRACTSPGKSWHSRRFFEAKLKEQRSRHHRFHDTGYKIEPNIKESPGGLRDIQMIGWVAKRHFNAETLHDLVDHDFLTETEYETLMLHQSFLWKVRMALHYLTGRGEDRLLLDFQRALALQFGYRDEHHQLGVEQFMKRYFRSVKELTQLNDMLLELFQEEILYADQSGDPIAINDRFQHRKGFLEVGHPGVFTEQPSALLELFLLLEQHPELKGVRAETIRLVRGHLHLIDDTFRADLECRRLFMAILRQSRGITHEFRRMHRYGVLGAYLPVFGNITGQMQYDLFHVYTVDEHTLFVIRNLRRFAVDEFRHEFPHCSSVFRRIAKPELLYLAALFHDIAKGRGGDHSELGAKDALGFCRHHEVPESESQLVSWLVESHLLMSRTSQREDISDPDVVRRFAEKVGDRRRLDHLYLLTVADIRATNPEVWNSWKAALLIELYEATKHALRRSLSLSAEDRILVTQEQSRSELEQLGVLADAINRFWGDLPEEYFLRYAPEEVSAQTHAILTSSAADLPIVLLRESQGRGGTDIFIYTCDRDNLFAAVTAVLDQLNLNVADARIISSRSGFALDSYLVMNQAGEPIRNALHMQEIRDAIQNQLMRSRTQVAAVHRREPRRHKHVQTPTEVHFSPDPTHPNRTVMEIITTDRPGLLANIGRALQHTETKLHNARIATFGNRAEDIFYVTDRRNRPLDSRAQTRLRAALERQLSV